MKEKDQDRPRLQPQRKKAMLAGIETPCPADLKIRN
jgi:hypothetical protein